MYEKRYVHVSQLSRILCELIKVAELTRWIVWPYCCTLRYLLFVSYRSELIKVAELNRWIV